jgi:hypothetical protein
MKIVNITKLALLTIASLQVKKLLLVSQYTFLISLVQVEEQAGTGLLVKRQKMALCWQHTMCLTL